MAEGREDPALHDQHGRFHGRLISGAATPRGHDRDPVVTGEPEVRAVDHRLVATGLGDAAAQVIRDEDRGAALEVLQHPDVGTDPRRQVLAEARFGVRIVRGAEDADEELDGEELAGLRIAQHGPLAREVDEGLLAGAVHLTHRRGQGADPALIVAAELAVAVAVGMGVEVLQPQALERDARALELLVEPRHVRQRPWDADQVVDSLEEAGFQLDVVQVVRERPAQPRLGSPGGSTRRRSPGRPHRHGPRPAGAGRRPTAVAGSRGSVASAASPSASRHLLGWEAPYRRRGATDACSGWSESRVRDPPE